MKLKQSLMAHAGNIINAEYLFGDCTNYLFLVSTMSQIWGIGETTEEAPTHITYCPFFIFYCRYLVLLIMKGLVQVLLVSLALYHKSSSSDVDDLSECNLIYLYNYK